MRAPSPPTPWIGGGLTSHLMDRRARAYLSVLIIIACPSARGRGSANPGKPRAVPQPSRGWCYGAVGARVIYTTTRVAFETPPHPNHRSARRQAAVGVH